MANNFTTTRNIELSVINYLETEIPGSWSNIAVVKGFNQAYKEPLPVVAIRLINTTSTRKELGNYDLRNVYSITLDIFAKSDGQRLDLSDSILNMIKKGIPYYVFSHSSGDPETLDKVQDGKLVINTFNENRKLEFSLEGLSAHDKYRHIIRFTVRR